MFWQLFIILGHKNPLISIQYFILTEFQIVLLSTHRKFTLNRHVRYLVVYLWMINWITISHFWIWWMKNKNNSRKMNHILYIIQMMDKIIAQYDTRWMRIEIQKKESTRLLCCWWVRRKRCINDHTHVLKTIKKANIPRRSLKITITKTEVAHPKHLSKCWKNTWIFFFKFGFYQCFHSLNECIFSLFNWSKDNNLFIAHTQWRPTAHQS